MQKLFTILLALAIVLPSYAGKVPVRKDDSTNNVTDDLNFTGTIIWSGSGTLEVPNGTSPTVNTAGELAVDTDGDGTNVTQGVVTYYDGTQQMYIAGFDTFPTTDGYALKFDTGTNKLVWEAGDASTASNQGASGVGVFDTTVGVDHQFRNIAPGSANVTVTLSTKDIDIDLASALDLGASTSLEVPNSTGPTVNAAGEVAVDTNGDGTNVTQGVLTYYDGTQQMYAAGFDAYPSTDGYVLTFDSATNKLAWEQVPAAVGVYRYLYADAAAFVARTTNGAAKTSEEKATNDIMVDSYAFDQTTEEGIQFKFVLPDEWDAGTIKVKFYWTSDTGTGNVVWGIRSGSYTDSDALDTALGTTVTVTDSAITADDVHVTSATGGMTVGGSPAAGHMIVFEVLRIAGDASDTLADDAKLLGVALQYNETTTETSAW